MKIEKLKHLKEFLNSLTDEQLERSAIIHHEDEHLYISEAGLNEEDYFWNEDSEGLIPVSEYDPEEWDDVPLEHESNTIVKAGTMPIIFAD